MLTLTALGPSFEDLACYRCISVVLSPCDPIEATSHESYFRHKGPVEVCELEERNK